MSVISEKIAYLRGLAEGMNIDKNSNETKLFYEMCNILDEIAGDIEYLEESQDELFDRVYDIEDEVYGEEFDNEYDFMDDDDDDEQFSIKCPSCGEEFFIDSDDLDSDEDIVCPNCDETIELEFGCDCGCDDCEDCD